MRCAFDASIDATQCDHVSLGAAADLVDYFKTHAQRVYARLIARPQDVRLLRVVSWTKEHGGHCTPREVVRAGVSGIKTTAEAEAILAEIAANCWGRYETIPNPRGKDTMRLMLYDPTPDTKAEGEK
jgi:hypothetical protein